MQERKQGRCVILETDETGGCDAQSPIIQLLAPTIFVLHLGIMSAWREHGDMGAGASLRLQNCSLSSLLWKFLGFSHGVVQLFPVSWDWPDVNKYCNGWVTRPKVGNTLGGSGWVEFISYGWYAC